ncbi:MAG: hypothetical protein WC523_00135 [Patescibacteria group bacterium]
MKIEFADKSYLELIKTDNGVSVILCGIKNKNQTTISSANLTNEQSKEIFDFFRKIIENSVL